MDREPTRGQVPVVVAVVATLLASAPAAAESKGGRGAGALREAFRTPDNDYRPTVRWLWPGTRVSLGGIERELAQIRNAGFGGVEIQAVAHVPVASDPTRPLAALQADMLEAIAFAGVKARELGLTVDLALGSGAPWGGPELKAEHAPRHLQEVGEPLLRALGVGARAVVADRQGTVAANWTSDLPAQFRKRRGYDIASVLPSLTTRQPDTADLRHDYAATLGELLDERYFEPLQEWSRSRRVSLRASVGMPLPATLSSLRFADLPEGQGLPWNALAGVRWASSAAHLFGKPASAVIWTDAPAGFGASPLDLKVDADQALLSGATHLVGDAWPYSADTPDTTDAGISWLLPGATAVNPRNPWWPVMSELALYLRRATFVARQGEPVADVAVYLPTHDALSDLAPGDVNLSKAIANRIGPDLVPAILAAGFSFDLVDDRSLQSMAEVRGRTLRIGNNAYGIVILPNVERLPASTLALLQSFGAAGGTLLATRRFPSKLPGAHQARTENERLRAAVEPLFEGPKSFGKLVRDEKGELGSVLRKALEPDVRTAIVSPHIGFVHRRTPDLDFYFLVNTASVPYDNMAEFRVQSRTAEWWDTRSGNSSPTAALASSATTAKVRVSLAPYESKTLVFGLAPPDRERVGRSSKKAENEAPSLTMDLSNGWEVSFEGTELRKRMEWLSSWTESADTRTFSGEAIYRKDVVVRQSQWLSARPLLLGLGDTRPTLNGAADLSASARVESPVREAAMVLVNGKRAGFSWCPPYDVDVSGLLRAGTNVFEIRVYNLASNHLAGRPRRLGNVDANSPLEPSSLRWAPPSTAGLLGPIMLRTADAP